ncbi:hypothetical protein C0J52_01577 [Blattella germanica]|nr:hypothetical protein C0J52_01577 [Blattella germanica]
MCVLNQVLIPSSRSVIGDIKSHARIDGVDCNSHLSTLDNSIMQWHRVIIIWNRQFYIVLEGS